MNKEEYPIEEELEEFMQLSNKLMQENKQLKNNWIKLKEYIDEIGSPFVDGYGYIQIEDKIVYADDILDKMQELERDDSNE